MKTTIAAALAATALTATAAAAQDEVTLQLKWVTQAQFAGYYAAKDQGFYEDADLDVTIKPGGPDIAPAQVIAGGGADVITTWMAAGLAARERGVPLVNIAQPFDKGGLQLTCLKSTGVTSPEDFPGHTLGVWFAGNEYPFFAWMAKLGIPTDGSEGGVEVLKQGFNVDPLIQGQAACIATMTYNEYGQVIDAGYKPEDLKVFNYLDQGVGMLEDGLYATEEDLEDPAFRDKMARFVAASMKGWHWAVDHPEKAAQIVVDNDMSGAQTLHHQEYMMSQIGDLVADGVGELDPDSYRQTVRTLLSAISEQNPAITEDPGDGAWTHEITDMAKDD